MPRPTPGDYPIPLTPAAPGVNGYAPPTATSGQYAQNPFAVANPTAPPSSTGRALPTVGELLSAFKRRWPLALMIGVVVAVLMAGGIWLAMPSGKHRVEARLQFKSTLTNLLGGNTDLSQDQFNKQMEGHKKHMESKEFLDRVAADPAVGALPTINNTPVEDRANAIRGMFTFKRETDEFVTLTLNGEDENEMKVILETMVKEYMLKEVSDEKAVRKKTLDDLERSLKDVEGKIDTRRQAIKDKRGAAGERDPILDQLILGRIASTETQLSNKRAESNSAKGQREFISRQFADGSFPIDLADLEVEYTMSTQVKEKRALLLAAEKRAEQAKAFVPGDPARVEAEAAVKAAGKAVEEAKKDVMANSADSLKAKQKNRLQVEMAKHDQTYQLAQQSVEQLQKQLDDLLGEQKKQKGNGIDVTAAEKDIEPLVNSKGDLLKQKNDLELIERNTSPRIIVIDKPEIYRFYNLKQKYAFAAIAAIAGLLVVCLLVSYVEWRNRRVDGVDQVVSELGMRVIGTIPAFPSRAALRAGETGANQNWRFILNESVNSTRTMLLHTARTQQMQVILVTSAMQGEGKTSLSSQLATSMATAGLRTLILDCDLRNPSMQKLFDVPVAPGCAEILLQEIDISDAVQQTSVPNLSIIPAGQCNHRVIAALAQGHPIEALLNRLRGQYDIIIVDSCPILPVADTLLVAQHVDGVVFSILQDVSQLPKVQDASERMVQLGIPLLGAVVNGIKPDIQAYGYNYVKQLPA